MVKGRTRRIERARIQMLRLFEATLRSEGIESMAREVGVGSERRKKKEEGSVGEVMRTSLALDG